MELLIRRLQQKEAEIANYLTIIEGQRQNIEWMQRDLHKLDPKRYPEDMTPETQFNLNKALKEEREQCMEKNPNQKNQNPNQKEKEKRNDW